jgi:hypothetical protein
MKPRIPSLPAADIQRKFHGNPLRLKDSKFSKKQEKLPNEILKKVKKNTNSNMTRKQSPITYPLENRFGTCKQTF